MGKRLTGFDYSRAMFYMVTIKCRAGVQALCEIVAPGKCQMNAITRAMVNCIRNFHLGCEQIARIECFSIMPDHIHLLIRIVDRSKALKEDAAGTSASTSRKSSAPIRLLRLETIVDLLMQALEGRYREVTGLREQAFEASWHDWIVTAEGQLAAFTRYIRENPRRAFLREENRRYFTSVRRVSFAGREWFAYGNAAILELPVIEPFRCSRKWEEEGAEWREAVGRAERIGPGGAGCGTFMSPCEKACGNAIYQAGGALIVLSPEGFAPRWHPPRNKEALCAKGRVAKELRLVVAARRRVAKVLRLVVAARRRVAKELRRVAAMRRPVAKELRLVVAARRLAVAADLKSIAPKREIRVNWQVKDARNRKR